MLSGDNMEQPISISIADDHVETAAGQREFILRVSSTVVNNLRVIDPMFLTVIIKDNDTGEVVMFSFSPNFCDLVLPTNLRMP